MGTHFTSSSTLSHNSVSGWSRRLPRSSRRRDMGVARLISLSSLLPYEDPEAALLSSRFGACPGSAAYSAVARVVRKEVQADAEADIEDCSGSAALRVGHTVGKADSRGRLRVARATRASWRADQRPLEGIKDDRRSRTTGGYQRRFGETKYDRGNFDRAE